METAAARCAEIYDDTGDARAGALAAHAELARGRDDEVLRWADRLAGTDQEAAVLGSAAEAYRQSGERDLERAAYERQVGLWRRAGDRAAAAAAGYRLFYAAWEASDYRRALAAARGSFEDAAAAGEAEPQSRAAEALFTVLYSLGDLEGAERALDAAVTLRPAAGAADLARLLANRGALRVDRGHMALARDPLERALELAAGTGDPRFYRSIHLNLVRANLALGEVERAARHLEAAWDHADPDPRARTALLFYRAETALAGGDADRAERAVGEALGADPIPDWAWDLERLRGRALELRGDPAAAEQAYARAARIVEEMRRSLGFDELKSWLVDRKREPFERLFRLQAVSGRIEQALETVERVRARAFVDDFVAAGEASGGEAREGPGWPSEAAARRLDLLEELVPPLLESGAVRGEAIERVLAAAAGRPALVYFASGGDLWLVAVRGGRLEGRVVAGVEEVERRARSLAARPDDPRSASELGEMLLPGWALPAAGGVLVVVTDGELGRLPFALLRRGGRYLVEDHALAYAPSLTWLAGRGGREADAPPVVLGDPLGDLPAARRELTSVAALLGVEPAAGAAATLERLGAAGPAAVLHLATHTGTGPGGPWMRLAGGEVGAQVVVARRLAPRLVVLAGCASARPRGRTLWGSLGAAFVAAGSRAVVASLWSIDDRATRELIVAFYREGGATRPARALARAQRAAIAAGAPASEWAPFVVLTAEWPD